LDYACAAYSAGSVFEILVGNNKLQRKTVRTAGWLAFQAIKLGAIEIDRTGVMTVQIRPVNKTGEAVMNLRTVLLRPRAQTIAEAVGQAADGSFQLQAPDAKIVGKTALAEDENVGYWTNPKDYVEWKLQVRTPGKFQVAVDYACIPQSAGSDYEVVVGGERLPAKVAATGSWRDFRTVSIGSIQIDRAGVATLQVKPVNIGKGAVMNLRNVFLRPALDSSDKPGG
jgi:hypothetical protein